MDEGDVIYVGRSSGRTSRHSSKSQSKERQGIEVPPIESLNLTVEENHRKEKVILDGWLELTLDEDEDELYEEVKALWNNDLNKIERFSLRKSDPLLPVFQHFAKIHNVELSKIMIVTETYSPVHHYDSVESLNLKVTNFLIASILTSVEESVATNLGENRMEVKCLLKNRKQPILCQLHKNQPFSAIVQQCAVELKCTPDKIKLIFDGDIISLKDTPKSLDLEGGECIDVTFW